MTTTLRLVLDQLVAPTDALLASASLELARALVASAPRGCEVEALVPATAAGAPDVAELVPGLARVTRAPLARRELSAAWQLGVGPLSGGMVHAPTLMAPLVRHDRAHSGDQTVVTINKLDLWTAPDELARGALMWSKAMLRRAERHADAVVVPTHAMAAELGARTGLGDRLRVIPGAAPAGFAAPSDAAERARALDLPARYLAMAGSARPSSGVADALAALAADADLSLVVLDVPAADVETLTELAEAAGIASRLQLFGAMDAAERATIWATATAVLAPATGFAFPARMIEAFAVGAPVIARDTLTLREVAADAASLVSSDAPDAWATAVADLLGDADSAKRLGVLAADRSRAFAWRDAGDRVWALHADL